MLHLDYRIAKCCRGEGSSIINQVIKLFFCYFQNKHFKDKCNAPTPCFSLSLFFVYSAIGRLLMVTCPKTYLFNNQNLSQNSNQQENKESIKIKALWQMEAKNDQILIFTHFPKIRYHSHINLFLSFSHFLLIFSYNDLF